MLPCFNDWFVKELALVSMKYIFYSDLSKQLISHTVFHGDVNRVMI